MSSNYSDQIKFQNVRSTKENTPQISKVANRTNKEKPLGERRNAVLRQELMVFLGNTGIMGAGMAIALPSVTLDQLTDPTENFHLSEEKASWFSSINSMACPLGGLLVGYLMDRVGRKITIVVTDICGVLGWALLATAPLHKDGSAVFIQILVARFVSGIMIGLSVSPVGVYSAEISLPKIRGRLILGTSIAIAAGILFMYVLGYFIRNDWQLIAIISTGYQIFSTICALPMPETPSWLMQKGYAEKARRSLKYFRGLNKNDVSYCEEFENELSQIKATSELSRDSAESESLLQAVKTPEVYKPLLLMIGLFGFQQCSGIVVVVVYAVQIATVAGVSIDPRLCAVFVGMARIITTFFMSTIFERWGRKPAGLISAAGMAVCMLLLACSGWFPEEFKKVSVIPAICIILHIIFSTLGLLTLPFFMISEVFPQRVRGSASGFSVSCGLLMSFAVIKLYPAMESLFGTPNLFAFYGLVSLVAVPFIYFLVPETKGRTLLEIEEYFKTSRMAAPTKINMRNSTISSNNNEVDDDVLETFLKP